MGPFFSFQMERCVFGVLFCCPVLIELTMPPGMDPKDANGGSDALRKVFHEFHAADNFANYWEGWAWVTSGQNAIWVKESVFPEIPVNDQTLSFGTRFDEAQRLVFEKGDSAAAGALMAAAVPSDLAVESTGLLGDRLVDGARYGATIAELPAPPERMLQIGR